MQRAFRWWLIVFGAVCAGIGAAHVFSGTASVIGGTAVNATLDSEFRFYAVLFLAFGLAFIWCARDVAGRAPAITVLGAIFFAGGLARLVSWAVMGPPHWFFQLMTLVELVIPPVNFLLVRRITDNAAAPSRV